MRTKHKSDFSLEGFTLIELMVVLVIIGILILLALPNLTPLITKAKSMEAQLQLEHLHTLQQNHFYLYSRYSEDLDELNFEAPASVEEGGTSNYQFEIVYANKNEFLARATATTDFDGDGVFNQWEVNQDKIIEETIRD